MPRNVIIKKAKDRQYNLAMRHECLAMLMPEEESGNGVRCEGKGIGLTLVIDIVYCYLARAFVHFDIWEGARGGEGG
jgi:hypothetical protein